MHEFFTRFVVLKNEKTGLPYTVGGLTQKGPHFGEDQNNQDAMSILVSENIIIAVVCDGCSGGSDSSSNTYSYNEFAAQTISVLAIKYIQEYIKKEDVINDDIALFLEDHLLSDLEKMITIFDNGILNIKDYLVMELFMSTVIISIIYKGKWYVLHGGDGVVIIDDNITNLKDYSGIYISNKLHSKNGCDSNILKIIGKGDTSNLNHILIATDGIYDFIKKDKEKFISICSELENRSTNYNKGYDEKFLREFNKRFVRQWEKKERTDHDDRTFILVRRLPFTEEAKLNITQAKEFINEKCDIPMEETTKNDKVNT